MDKIARENLNIALLLTDVEMSGMLGGELGEWFRVTRPRTAMVSPSAIPCSDAGSKDILHRKTVHSSQCLRKNNTRDPPSRPHSTARSARRQRLLVGQDLHDLGIAGRAHRQFNSGQRTSAVEELNHARFIAEFRRFALLPPPLQAPD